MKRNHVLLIEDYPVHQMLEEEALMEAGYKVTSISDADAAITAIDEQLANAPEKWRIVVDLRLLGEDMAGARVIETLKHHKDMALARVPVLVASANSKEEIEKDLKSRGLSIYPVIEKPFDMKDFITAVGRLEDD